MSGISTFSGCKMGIGSHLRKLNPALINDHCRDHRLALECKNSFAGMPGLAKLDQTVDSLQKYYKYTTNWPTPKLLSRGFACLGSLHVGSLYLHHLAPGLGCSTHG